MPTSTADQLRRALNALALIAFVIAVVDTFGDGLRFHVGSIRLSMRDPVRALIVAGIAKGLASYCDRRADPRGVWEHLQTWSPWLAGAAAVATILTGIHFGVFVAGGSDGYGYVSQAVLWATGTLHVPEPLMAVTPSLGASVAPLGYLPAPGHTIVPTYPPGLPMLMAVALRMAGPDAVYVVVPVLGGVAVWLTYCVGKHVAGPRTGLIAALLFACSPIFLFQLILPMSDVPATAWWLAALAMAFPRPAWAALLSGFAVSAALLTRPNLAPLAMVAGLLVLKHSPSKLPRMAAFAAGLVPGFVMIAWTNWFLFGSATSSGYGPVVSLFKWGWLAENLSHYPVWLLELQTAFILVAFAAPFVTGLRDARSGEDAGPADQAVTWLMLAFFVILLSLYAFYIPWNGWPFLRFLLPGIPLLLILSSAVAVRLIGRLPAPLRGPSVLVLCALLCGWSLSKADSLSIFVTAAGEQRYETVGRFVDREFPQNALFISKIESGSVRLYGHRTSVRWDLIEPEAFDRTIETLRAHGYAPYLLLEDWEEPLFRQRFAQARLAQLDSAPLAALPGLISVSIYSVGEHADAAPALVRRIVR